MLIALRAAYKQPGEIVACSQSSSDVTFSQWKSNAGSVPWRRVPCWHDTLYQLCCAGLLVTKPRNASPPMWLLIAWTSISAVIHELHKKLVNLPWNSSPALWLMIAWTSSHLLTWHALPAKPWNFVVVNRLDFQMWFMTGTRKSYSVVNHTYSCWTLKFHNFVGMHIWSRTRELQVQLCGC